MKKKLFILLSLVLIPSLLFAWTEPTGSTFTVISGESQEIKDIQNDVHDVTHAAFTVYNISTGPYNSLSWVWNGSTWTILETSINNMDGVGVSSPSLNTKTFLYAYNGTSWDRVRSTKDMFLEVKSVMKEGEKAEDIKDIKGPVEIKFSYKKAIIFGIIVLLFAWFFLG